MHPFVTGVRAGCDGGAARGPYQGLSQAGDRGIEPRAMVLETISRCRYTSPPGAGIVGDSVRHSCEHVFVSWKPPDDYSYAYLLGAYLGDGYLSRAGQLLVVCDRKYPGIVEEVRGAMILTSCAGTSAFRPHRRPPVRPRGVQLARLVRGVPAAWARTQARAADRAGAVAGGDRRARTPGNSCADCCIRTARSRTITSLHDQASPSTAGSGVPYPRWFFSNMIGRHPRPVLHPRPRTRRMAAPGQHDGRPRRASRSLGGLHVGADGDAWSQRHLALRAWLESCPRQRRL